MCFVVRRVQLKERRTERLTGAVCGGLGGVHHGWAGETPPPG